MQTIRCGVFRNPLKVFSRDVFNRFAHIEYKVKVNDLEINIVQSGRGENSVLLMPGTLGTVWSDFKPQIEKLPELLPNYTVFAWDPPGFGKSIPPNRQWSLDIFYNDAQCAVDLMKTLHRPKFSIVGWSAGGLTGLVAAWRYIENIEKLIIWGAGGYLVEQEVKGFQSIRDVSKWSARMREPMEEVYGVERFAELWREWVDLVAALYTERRGDMIGKDNIKNIKSPVLILRGKKDPVISPEPIAYLRENIKNVRYHEFPDGKHNLHLRYADEFNAIVAKFLLEN